MEQIFILTNWICWFWLKTFSIKEQIELNEKFNALVYVVD